MQYTIDTSQKMNINWNATGKEKIVQNVFNLINTFKFEVAYNREKGISPDILDKPINVLAAGYIAEVYRLVEDYESRAKVESVKFIGADDNGNAQFKVVIDV